MSDPAVLTRFLLAIYIIDFVLGGVIFAALVVQRWYWQVALALFLSLVGVSLFNSVDTKDVFIPIRGGNWTSLVLMALFTLVLARLTFAWAKKRREKRRRCLIPHLWDRPETKSASFEDLRKRWFVTISAATGSVVGIVLLDPAHWGTIASAFGASQIFFTLFLTVISFTLIGPGEEFILGAGASNQKDAQEEPHNIFEEAIHDMSPRAVGRFLLVIAAWLLLSVVHKCMDATLSEGQTSTATELLLGSVPPGILTYYWCAALQHDVPSVARKSFTAVRHATGLLFLSAPVVIGLYVYVRGIAGDAPKSFGDFAAAIGIGAILALALWLIALLSATFGGVLYGVAAFCGGTVLDMDRAKPGRSSFHTVAVLAIVLGLWNALLALGPLLALSRFNHTPFNAQLLLVSALGSFGWAVGLLVSGFPKIVEHARSRTSQAAMAIPAAKPV